MLDQLKKWLWPNPLTFDDLLNCPGCGHKPTIRSISQEYDFCVYCVRDKCKYFEMGVGPFNSAHEAIKKWNRVVK
jgi:pyruvate/2-oxoacid:ferredoxin oxidoreductase beta subunit